LGVGDNHPGPLHKRGHMKLTNKYNLPESFVNCIKNDTYTGPQANTNKISVTTIINPPKIHFLKCRHWDEIEEDLSENIWRLIGSSVHAMLERAEGKDSIVEERLNKEIDGITLSGAFDLYDSKKQELQDFKVTSA